MHSLHMSGLRCSCGTYFYPTFCWFLKALIAFLLLTSWYIIGIYLFFWNVSHDIFEPGCFSIAFPHLILFYREFRKCLLITDLEEISVFLPTFFWNTMTFLPIKYELSLEHALHFVFFFEVLLFVFSHVAVYMQVCHLGFWSVTWCYPFSCVIYICPPKLLNENR